MELNSPFKKSVVESALWAAAGDALGWISELAHGKAGLKNRIGATEVKQPVAWQRLIGGRNGPKVALPAGTYSDDTQLRLAVSRSIRGNGFFDVETFAKIELPVWPTYALGAGLGSKAAALNLSRRGVNWFSNFFDRGTQKYINGGGNGAAMRIQPHVWSSRGDENDMLLNVVRDSVVTHGHPHGFCGAVFHALTLRETLQEGRVPGPESWLKFADRFLSIPDLIRKDNQLDTFWRTTWEAAAGGSLEEAVSHMHKEACRDIHLVADAIRSDGRSAYYNSLTAIGCLTDRFRGSGFKTALAANALSTLHQNSHIEDALIVAANVLDSDTDTIATMAGAILGAIAGRPPKWNIQDSDYISAEAHRLAEIALGKNQTSFAYPDIGKWNPPTNQGAAVGMHREGLALSGLGILELYGDEFKAGEAVWQWSTLPFGQTILAKRKSILNESVSDDQLPRLDAIRPEHNRGETTSSRPIDPHQPALNFESEKHGDVLKRMTNEDFLDDLDAETDAVISSNFDNETLGKILNKRIESTLSIESAMALVAIIAKAKIARTKRRK
ncbi:TPA: ADP-ribosylglycohydrolase family protein [Pseudomonas aeruginosa]|nr:ADP-ribosylglycohydrolase family protein [Pseudomonas aeruginosa]HDY6331757.1 ADP-ribosylglycohydrolase family protein [Pseudomonas aeruginosa]